MAAVAEQPADLRTDEPPSSGFTAVNGRSPSTAANGHPADSASAIPGDTIKVARSPYTSPSTVHKKPHAASTAAKAASAPTKSRPAATDAPSSGRKVELTTRPVATPSTPPTPTASTATATAADATDAPATAAAALAPINTAAAHSPPPASESESASDASPSSVTAKRKRPTPAASGSPTSTTSPQSHKRVMSDAPELRPIEPHGMADHRRALSEHGTHVTPDGRYPTQMDWTYDASKRMDDSQLAEALQRENMNHATDDPSTPRYGQLGPHMHMDGVVPIPPSTSLASASKQRKRNFSNRTKTGCLTCRRRKKKCDERKPKCHNCERGGFDCAGYAKSNPYPKQPSNPKGPLPLQAKDRFGEPIPQGLPPPGIVRPMNHPYYPNPSQNVYVPHDQVESQPPRPPTHTDERNHRIMPMPQEPSPQSAHTYGPPQAPWPAENLRRPSYSGPEPVLRSDFPHRGPPPPPSGYPSDSHKNPLSPQRQLPHPPLPAQPRTNSNPHLFSSNHRVTAQLALDHTVNKSPPQTIPHMAPMPPQQQQPPPPPPPPPRSAPPEPHYRNEKEKMLHGVAYNDKDSQLVKEREDCKSALFKFNRDAVDPLVSESQLRATFKQLIEPDRLKSSGQHPNPPPIGRVGSNVTVAPHFFCQYGYNILIGDEVEIRNNCTILDSARVSIGARTTIGPNVCLYTEDLDLKGYSRLPNGKWKSITRPITIEEEVYIGGGCIIMPGVTIGRGAVVAAGSVVRQTIRPMTLGCNDIKQLAPKTYWAHHPPR